MSSQIAWNVEFAVKPGQIGRFRELTGEMVEFTRTEPDVLCYERYVSEDGKLVHVLERYADSVAALSHLMNFRAKFADRFSRLVDRRRFTVYGAPSVELRAMLDGFGAVYFSVLSRIG